MSENKYRKDRGFKALSEDLLSRLSVCFSDLKRKDFDVARLGFIDLMLRVRLWDNPDVEDKLEILKQCISPDDLSKGDEFVARSPLGPIIIATTYVLRAKYARQQIGDDEQAWSYLTDASYWCGVAVSGRGLDEARKKEFRERAEKGGVAKKRRYESIKAHALGLLRSEMPSQGWQSVLNAVEKLHPKINSFAEGNAGGAKAVSPKTVEEWFRGAPDQAAIFKNARKSAGGG